MVRRSTKGTLGIGFVTGERASERARWRLSFGIWSNRTAMRSAVTSTWQELTASTKC